MMLVMNRSIRRSLCASQVVSRALCSRPHVVTIDYAKSMPRSFRDMPNDIILTMAVMGEQGARTERLIRDIMVRFQ